jgi:hypothetical protein
VTTIADWSSEQRAVKQSQLAHDQQRAFPGLQEPTIEERLLDEVLAANEEILEALRIYDDLHQLEIEREVEKRSHTDTRMGRLVRLRAAHVCAWRSHCGCSRTPAVGMVAGVTTRRISTFPVQGPVQAAGEARVAARTRPCRRRQMAGPRRHLQVHTRI